MTTQELIAFYTQRKNTFSESFTKVKKQIDLISNARLLVAGIFLVMLYLSFQHLVLFYFLPAILLVFVVLVRMHSKYFDEKVHLENLILINDNELKALHGNFSNFHNGVEFINAQHPYTHDLDIFGEGSLYQYLNRSCTLNGAQQLAHALANPLTSTEVINTRQIAIGELADKPEFRQHFLASGMQLEEFVNDKQQLLEWSKQKPFLYGNKFYGLLLWVFPLLTIGLIATAVFVDGFAKFALLAAGLQWTFLGFHLKKVNAFHQYISRKKNVLDKYAQLLVLFGKEKFQTPLLVTHSSKALEADKKVNTLASLARALDARLNFLTNMVVNSLLLYDLQCVYRLEKWKEENASNLLDWMDVISEVDVLCSFATFTFNHADFVFPAITNDQKITALEMGHPLIDAAHRVSNTIIMGGPQPVMIITGANMAGKSTFLRTLGINMVLALNGAPVCAKTFSCPIIGIRSGMRTADSLQDNQSYFYAELNRLKNIMDELRSGQPLLILLDEILKGTNSTDKQAGSIALVKQLLAQACLAIIATHDLALGELEHEYPDNVKNYCFEPTIENDQLTFDYKLKPGLAQKMNATFLMKKMGIIPA